MQSNGQEQPNTQSSEIMAHLAGNNGQYNEELKEKRARKYVIHRRKPLVNEKSEKNT